MPWNEVDLMSLRKEFVLLSQQEESNISQLCKRFDISRKTGYKWIKRYKEGGVENLQDRSKKPNTCPHQTDKSIEQAITENREKGWGGRKIRSRLIQLGYENVPSASTITAVLRRLGLLDEKESHKHKAYKRFEKDTPNELWQMDFKGDFPTLKARCYPLSILDDCTRFVPGLFSCANQQRETVQDSLESVFRMYGMPRAMLMDNGSPWGGCKTCEYTRLTIWLIRLGIRVYHGRPYHPQTQGKVERFHRTFKQELLIRESFVDLEYCQRRFDEWRYEYNFERPHEALDMDVPANHYTSSPFVYPGSLPDIEYAPGSIIRKVQQGGRVAYRGEDYRVSRALVGCPVALKPAMTDGMMDVYFCRQKIKTLDLRLNEIKEDNLAIQKKASQ